MVVTDGSEATDFGLSNSGEEVWLEDGTGAVIDDVVFPALAAGETYARIPDGGTNWKIVTDYTKGKSNVVGSAVVMNEIYSRGTATEPDWIELYNITNANVDLTNYKIYDSGAKGGTKDKKGFPAGTSIPAKGFYIVVTDGSEASDFGLSNSGEEVWLEDGTGTVVDDVVFPALATGETYARIPDGSSTWQIVTTYTKGKSNDTGTSVESNDEIISEYKLFQNHPNPFNPETNISYIIPKDGFVTIKIYNILGSEEAVLINQFQSAGLYNLKLSSSQLKLTSGIYFYKLQSGNYVAIKKMVLLK